MRKQRNIAVASFIALMFFGFSLVSIQASAVYYWYEYEYHTYSADDHEFDDWGEGMGIIEFWQHTEVTLKYKYKCWYHPRLGLIQQIVGKWWYKIYSFVKLRYLDYPDYWYTMRHYAQFFILDQYLSELYRYLSGGSYWEHTYYPSGWVYHSYDFLKDKTHQPRTPTLETNIGVGVIL